jgi:molecular chaperone IbpA
MKPRRIEIAGSKAAQDQIEAPSDEAREAA